VTVCWLSLIDASMENRKVQAVVKYYYLKGMTPQDIVGDMKQTLWKYAAVTKYGMYLLGCVRLTF